MYTTLLYYNYVTIVDPAAEMVAQRELCERLGLKGRILLAGEGINGTVSGSNEACQAYIAAMHTHPLFATTEFKIETSDIIPFPRLRIKVRDEIVTLETPVDMAQTAPKITVTELHELLNDPEVVLFDARNNYESAIGHFKGAVMPDITLFKELPAALGQYAELKNKPIVTYCTGGIRCEKSSALMRQSGFTNVRQLDGGIIKYLQAFPKDGFEGSCFVFDERMQVTYGNAEPIASCNSCSNKTSHYQNCANPRCHDLILVCDSCVANVQTCSKICANILA